MSYILKTEEETRVLRKVDAEGIILEEIKENFKNKNVSSDLLELIVHTAPLDLLISYQEKNGGSKIKRANTFRGVGGA